MIKKRLLLIYCILTLFLMLYGLHSISANSSNKNSVILINSFEKDLTGDGFQEHIQLHGNLMNDDSSFYQNVWMTVQNAFEDKWSISLQHGYKPEVTFTDLSGNKNPDIFYKVAKDEHLNNYHYQLYQFDKNNVEAVDLPEHQHIEAKFANDYMIEIYVNPTKKPLTLDLSARSDEYIKHNIYSSNGRSKSKDTPKVSQNAHISPVLISSSKGYGLKTTQLIYGMDKNDIVGELTTIWHYENDKWINIKTKTQSKM